MLVGPSDMKVRRLRRDLSEMGAEVSTTESGDRSPRDLTIGVSSHPDDQVGSALEAAAIGSPYLSVSHSAAVVEALMARLSSSSNTTIAGVDWTPGITSMVAADAGLEGVSQVKVTWVTSAAGPSGGYGIQRVVEAFSDRAVTFEGGEWRRIDPGQRAEEVYLPPPFGWRTVWQSAGAEALLLGHGGLQTVSVRAALSEPLAAHTIRRARVLGAEAVARSLLKLPFKDVLGTDQGWSVARVDLYSQKGSRSYAFMDRLANLMVAPAVAAIGIWDRAVLNGGVKALHEVFPPSDFLEALAKGGLQLARLEPGTSTMSL